MKNKINNNWVFRVYDPIVGKYLRHTEILDRVGIIAEKEGDLSSCYKATNGDDGTGDWFMTFGEYNKHDNKMAPECGLIFELVTND